MSTSTGMSDCCLSGKLHSGNPTGREDSIGGLNCYVAEPKGESKAKTIVFFTDIFGWEFKNTRLLADQYAQAGFYCYIPDFFDGDALHVDLLDDLEPPLEVREKLGTVEKGVKTTKAFATLGPWLAVHREAKAKPIIDGFLNAVKLLPGTNKVGAIGFCWGGRYAILAAHGDVDAAFACHPSLVAAPADFEGLSKPLSLAVGDKDSLVPESEIPKFRDALDKHSAVPHELKVYEDQIHGFALRGDFSNEKDKQAMDGALKQGVAWFDKFLAA